MGRAKSNTGTGKSIDGERSVFTVRVYKTGLFSAFAHDHEMRAPIKRGILDAEKNSIEFTVDSRSLRVLDAKASESQRAEIQSSMLDAKVLNSEKYPEIRFHLTSIGEAGDHKLIVLGDLTLHGQTHSVRVDVVGSDGHLLWLGATQSERFRHHPDRARWRIDQRKG